MEKSDLLKELLKKIRSKKGQDYTYLTVFFLIFSAFIMFAIRPSLITAFSLKKEEKDLEQLDSNYEKTISTVVSNQSTLESLRDRLYLLNEALPISPQIDKLIKDILNNGKTNSINISNISVGDIDLINKTHNTQKKIIINLEANSSYENLIKFIKDLSNQRRLKILDSLEISTGSQSASQSGQLNIKMQIQGFYL